MKEEKFPHTRQPLHWRRQGAAGGKIRSHGGELSHRGAQGKAERCAQRISADQHSPALKACLLTRRDGWGLGTEALASEVRSQGEDWGWLREHSLKGASAPQLARRESRKKSGPA